MSSTGSARVVLCMALVAIIPSSASPLAGYMQRDAFVGNGVNHVFKYHLGLDLQAGATNATTHFYSEARLDHFDSAKNTTWKQRYYVDETHWCGVGCPVFLYIGGEGPQGPVSPHLLLSTLAAEHGALMVALEHRFYGASAPTPDMSTSNLRFLTSEQALADLARFVSYLTAFDPAVGTDDASSPPLALSAAVTASKVVGFGGSYPGNLAAWARLKYPALFAGTVASSAPVHAEFNFEQYAQVVGAAMAYPLIGGSATCASIAGLGITALKELLTSTSPMGTSTAIPAVLRPCTPLAGEDDLATYESNVFSAFQGAVQYNLQGRTPYVRDVCDELVGQPHEHTDPLDALALAVALFANNASSPATCVPSSWAKDNIASLTNITFDGTSSDRQWIWQSCNEFGFFQTTSGAGHPFTAFDSLGAKEAGAKICKAAFDLPPTYQGPDTQWANTNYGSRDLQATNVIIPNGNMDPWHALGIVNSSDAFYQSCTDAGQCKPQALTASDHTVFIDGTAHCRDMFAPGIFDAKGYPDTPPVKWAHARIAAGVARFLE